jgi:hypothetical protein
METKLHPVSLKQYRKVNGKWQFVPVARDALTTVLQRIGLVSQALQEEVLLSRRNRSELWLCSHRGAKRG